MHIQMILGQKKKIKVEIRQYFGDEDTACKTRWGGAESW